MFLSSLLFLRFPLLGLFRRVWCSCYCRVKVLKGAARLELRAQLEFM